MEPTIALNKICGLSKRIWGIQGGQGAGKTYSIVQILIDYALAEKNREIFVASYELSKMRITVIKDFVNIMKSFGIFKKSEFTGGTLYRYNNGSFIQFIGLDKADIGKGLRSHVMFVNEANKVDFETYRELTSRADRVIVDFNPNKNFWFHSEVMPRKDCDFLKLTFKDNNELGTAERSEILGYHEQGFNTDGTERNPYWANMWRVYGLGEIGQLQGAIYNNWSIGKFDNSLPFGYGLDFGSNDPDAFIKCAVDEKRKRIYAQEKIYKSNNNTNDLINLLRLNYDTGKLIVADSAGKRTIDDIKSKGFNIRAVEKPPIIDSIKLMQGYEIIVSPDSKHIIDEIMSYIWLEKKSGLPIDKYNHALDAIRYYLSTVTNPKRYLRGVISARMT